MIVDRWSDMRGIQIKRAVALAAAALLAIVALAIVAGIIMNIYNGAMRTEQQEILVYSLVIPLSFLALLLTYAKKLERAIIVRILIEYEEEHGGDNKEVLDKLWDELLCLPF
jgi:ABC-type dipeptide/oligopeptide/nickel transport system permease subunit